MHIICAVERITSVFVTVVVVKVNAELKVDIHDAKRGQCWRLSCSYLHFRTENVREFNHTVPKARYVPSLATYLGHV